MFYLFIYLLRTAVKDRLLVPRLELGSGSGLGLTPTLTLIKTEYWDRAGGRRNIVQETSMTNEEALESG